MAAIDHTAAARLSASNRVTGPTNPHGRGFSTLSLGKDGDAFRSARIAALSMGFQAVQTCPAMQERDVVNRAGRPWGTSACLSIRSAQID